MENSTSHHKFLPPLVVVLVMVSCGLLGTGNGTALAEMLGVHGTKINYESHHAYRECATGMNEKSEFVQDGCNNLRGGSYTDNEHLWVGQVTVIWYYNELGKPRSMAGFCDVPESQPGPFFTCSDSMEK